LALRAGLATGVPLRWVRLPGERPRRDSNQRRGRHGRNAGMNHIPAARARTQFHTSVGWSGQDHGADARRRCEADVCGAPGVAARAISRYQIVNGVTPIDLLLDSDGRINSAGTAKVDGRRQW